MKITKPKSFIINRKKWYRGNLKFTINRKKWYRGKDSGSMLRRPEDGMKCCLGFYANACGVSSQQITRRYGPEELKEPLPGVSRNISGGIGNTNVGWKMMDVNDDTDLNERERESKLRKLFRKIGVRVKFIN